VSPGLSDNRTNLKSFNAKAPEFLTKVFAALRLGIKAFRLKKGAA
jgi:hypothetical protein